MRHAYGTLGIATLFALGSAPISAETLADAIIQAYNTNPTLESSRYDVRATDEGLVQAYAQLRPSAELDVAGSYARTVEGRATQQANPFGPSAFNRNSNSVQMVVTQPVYTGGRATAAQRAAIANIHAGRETLRGAEGDLLLSVITAYVDIRRQYAALGIWQTSVDELGMLAQEIDARRIAGELTVTDVAQANAQLSIARQEVAATEQALEAARADYVTLVGRVPGELAAEPALPRLPSRVEDAFNLAELQNPELQRAVFTEEGSRATIVAAKAAGRPTLALRGTAGLSGEAVPYHLRDQDQSYSAGLVLTVPLSVGGAIASQIRQAEDRNGSDRFRIEVTRREVDRSVSYAWNQMVTAERQMALRQDRLRFAETQLDGMINEYRVGLRSTFDLLYAQQQLRDSQIALLASQRDYYISQAALLRQTGSLEVGAIMTGAQLHEPATHLHEIMRKNAVPWEMIFRKIDKAGAPGAKRRPLSQTHGDSPAPSWTPAATPPTTRDLSRSLPIAPIRDPMDQPVSGYGKPNR